MILLIDNYDSFSHNLDRYIRRLGLETRVARNDRITIQQVEKMQPSAIVLSPGPCTPNEAGISLELVQHFHATTPILGICLGHQTIVQAFGGQIVKSEHPVHGRSSEIVHQQQSVFAGLPSPIRIGRYHSLIANAPLPESLRITATTVDGIVMACQHVSLPVVGLQFHPESILTEFGFHMLAAFFRQANIHVADPASLMSTERTAQPLPRNSWPDRPVTF
ncbi:MAG: aminodeoxychorismate/anthranilate synthase component II [Pirellulaceae bacterium]